MDEALSGVRIEQYFMTEYFLYSMTKTRGSTLCVTRSKIMYACFPFRNTWPEKSAEVHV